MRKSILHGLVWMICVPALFSQQQRGGNTAGQPSTPTGQSPAGQQPSTATPKDPPGTIIQGRDRVGQRPLYLSGKVVLDDGAAPPELAEIVRVCGGRTYPGTFTDSTGKFSFELGGSQSLAADNVNVWARRSSGRPMGQPTSGGGFSGAGAQDLGHVNLAGCEIRARLPGYRSDAVALGPRSVFDNPDIGTIVLHRLDGVEGTAVSVTSLAAPKDARKAFENGQREMRKKKPNTGKARKEFEKAVASYPQYAAAWSALGELRLSMEELDGAQQAFEKALQADPKYLNPYQPMVRIHLLAERWDSAAALAEKALRLNPHMTTVQYFQALAHLNAGNMAEAEKAALAVQESKDSLDFPLTHRILGMVQAQQGNFEDAARQYRSYLALESHGPVAGELNRSLNEWEALGVIEKQPGGAAGATTAIKQ